MRCVAFLGLLAAVLLSACQRPDVEWRLGASPWPGNAPLFRAADGGGLGAGVRVVELASESAVLQAFRNQALEAAVMTLDEAMLLATEGHRLHVLALTDVSAGSGRIVAHPAIRGFPDLRGRRVALESAAVGAFILAHALRDAGLALGDLDVVALLPHEQVREYAAGRIDAAVSHEPFSGQLEKLGARVLFDTGQGDGDIVRALVVREDLVAAERGRIARLAQDFFAAQAAFAPDDSAVIAQAARRHGQTAAEFVVAWKGLRLLGEQENRDYLAADAARLRGLLAHIQEEMLAAGLIAQAPAGLSFGVPR